MTIRHAFILSLLSLIGTLLFIQFTIGKINTGNEEVSSGWLETTTKHLHLDQTFLEIRGHALLTMATGLKPPTNRANFNDVSLLLTPNESIIIHSPVKKSILSANSNNQAISSHISSLQGSGFTFIDKRLFYHRDRIEEKSNLRTTYLYQFDDEHFMKRANEAKVTLQILQDFKIIYETAPILRISTHSRDKIGAQLRKLGIETTLIGVSQIEESNEYQSESMQATHTYFGYSALRNWQGEAIGFVGFLKPIEPIIPVLYLVKKWLFLAWVILACTAAIVWFKIVLPLEQSISKIFELSTNPFPRNLRFAKGIKEVRLIKQAISNFTLLLQESSVTKKQANGLIAIHTQVTETCIPEQNMAIAIPADPIPRKRVPTSEPRLLLIDDEKEIVSLLGECLEDFFDVTTAMTGKEGLDLMNKHQFEYVVTDFGLPDIKGHTLLQQLNKMKPLEIIVITGAVESEVKLEALKPLGVTRIFFKPFEEFDDLLTFFQCLSENSKFSQSA